ncbi:MAG: septation protein IspZ [Succinivibrio sp.]|nr:septation protein IspZ [Succinivibrio sp.]
MPSLVKIIEFLPVIAFFTAYRLTSDLILATAIVVGSCVAATALEYLLTRTLSRLQIFLLCAVLLFGLPTVLLRDPQIIKWKVTVVNLLFALAIFITQYLLHKNPFAYLFGKELPLPAPAWQTLSLLWMLYFILAALLNVIIAFYLPALLGISAQQAESWWVDYKAFGNAILNFIFAVLAMLYVFWRYPGALQSLSAAKEQSASADKNDAASAPQNAQNKQAH